jgi:hypothetical protein
MGRLLKPHGAAAPLLAAVLALLCTARPAAASELDLSLDLRAVSSDATPARGMGGLGTLRYDQDHQGLRLGYLRVGFRGDVSPSLRVTVEAVGYGDHDVNALDLTEAYAEWRGLPSGAWRSRVKLGAFYPEISMENRMRGWRSPYTLSFSAIDTWVGEELRTIGGEYSLDWLGLTHGHNFELSSSVAAYGWNDPAGTVLATRGWGLSDRQSTLFGRFANHGQPLGDRTVFYDDLDKRAGYYASTTLRYRGLLELRALHYDNRANLAAEAPKIQDAAWQTRFEALGARWTPTSELTVIGQWLHGRTFDDVALPGNAWSYASEFLLASWSQSAWRYSLRYDRYSVQQTSSTFEYLPFLLDQGGHAWTASVDRALGDHWHLTLEGIQSDSHNVLRSYLGEPLQLRERQLQLALRWDK